MKATNVVAAAAVALAASPSEAASVREEIVVARPADAVWDAVRDFGAVDRRLVPGFVTAVQLDGDARIVTFANGTSARELLVDSDDRARRLVYAVVGSSKLKAHSASVQVIDEGSRTRLVWISDFAPNEMRPYIAAQMAEAAKVMKKTLESVSAASSAAR